MAYLRKPAWLKASLGGSGDYSKVRSVLAERRLHTVCEEARCPNKGECWGCGTATFLILGDVCTRNCGFCAVKTSAKGMPVDPQEPKNLAEVAKELNLRYAVITSVDRDDLKDKGAGHYAACIASLRGAGAKVEALIPDYCGDPLRTVVNSGPDVLAHNIEVVRRLQPLRDSRASYEKSLRTIAEAKAMGAVTKSSMMLGLGESLDEVSEAMDDLRAAGCSQLVIGQYLQPTQKQVKVVEYIRPDIFGEYARLASKKGFSKVVSEPLARTSYKAAESI